MTRKKLTTGAVFALLVLAVYVMLFHVRVLQDTTRIYFCSVCGMGAQEGARGFLGIRYRKYSQFPPSGQMPADYSQLVGVPHEHAWVYDAHTTSSRTLLGGGRWRHGDIFDVRVTRVMLALAAVGEEFKKAPLEFRRKLYFQLLNSDSTDEFDAMLENARDTSTGGQALDACAPETDQRQSEE